MLLPYSVEQWADPGMVEAALKLGGALPDGASVATTSCKAFGEEGILSVMAKVTVTYTGTPGGPTTVIAKTTPGEFTTRMLGRAFNLFSNEINFYQCGMAEQLGIQVPEVFFAHYDPKHARYILAMGDVGRPSADQIAGASPEQCCLIIDNLAKFHGPFFDRVREKAPDWLIQLDDDGIDVNALLADTYKKEVPRAIAELKDPAMWNLPPPPECEEYLTFLTEHYRPLQTQGEPPLEANAETGVHTTVMHGDPRLDNFFFDPYMIIDFQLVREGQPEQDLA